jgi:hypothetical protein
VRRASPGRDVRRARSFLTAGCAPARGGCGVARANRGRSGACYARLVAGKKSDLTVEILREIRDEIRHTNERLDTTRAEVNERLERLEKRQTETEVRLASELTAVVCAVRELSDILRDDRKLRTVVSDHESRITALERRTG